MTPKHQWEIVDLPKTYCGDHYCTGHYENKLICSCGWEKNLGGNRDRDEIDLIMIKHVLESEGLMV